MKVSYSFGCLGPGNCMSIDWRDWLKALSLSLIDASVPLLFTLSGSVVSFVTLNSVLDES
jgi:hypothetical protein